MDFDFFASLEKAEEVDGRYFIAGIASTNDVDQQNDIVSTDAIAQMAKSAIGLPIVRSHDHEGLDEFGTIVSAETQDNGTKLYIRAELDPDDSEAMRAYKKIQKGNKFGFSIGGQIKSVKNGIGKAKRVIDGVSLKHVMLTSKPVNQYTFATAIHKALAEIKEEPMNLEDILKNEDVQKYINDEIAKAGASLSADNKSKLKAIHDAGNDDVKSMVRSMLGMDADDVLGIAPGSASTEADPIGIADDAGNFEDPNAVAKSAITLEALEEFKKSIITEFKTELAKSAPKLESTLEKSEPVSDEKLAEMLSKGLFKKK